METVADIFPLPCSAVSNPREASPATSTDWAVDFWPHSLAKADWSTDDHLIQTDQCDSFFPDKNCNTEALLGLSGELQLGEVCRDGTRAAMFVSCLGGTGKGTLQKWENGADPLREAEGVARWMGCRGSGVPGREEACLWY